MNTDISSRTPEGFPNRCPVCANDVYITPSEPTGDAPCPRCGVLLWFFDTERGRIFVQRPEVEETKQPIREIVDEIAVLARREIPRKHFYNEFLIRVVTALAAEGGAVWTTDDANGIELACSMDFAKTNLINDKQGLARHNKLLGKTLSTGEPLLVAPRTDASEDADDGSNPTDFLLILAPLMADQQIKGVVEVFQRPVNRPATQRGYQRFLGQMCEIAGDYLAAQS